MILPLPSSPHWAPTRIVFAITACGARLSARVAFRTRFTCCQPPLHSSAPPEGAIKSPEFPFGVKVSLPPKTRNLKWPCQRRVLGGVFVLRAAGVALELAFQ